MADAGIYSAEFVSNGVSKAVYLKALEAISDNLHDLDHPNLRQAAVQRREAMARTAGGLLIYCARIQSSQFGFRLRGAFSERLVDLRHRFNIPEPE